MVGRGFTLFLISVFLLSCSESLASPTRNDSGDWIRIPNKFGALVWTHRSTLKAQLKLRSAAVSPEQIFFVFYRADRNFTFQLNEPLDKLLKSNVFDASNPTRIIIHGWQNNWSSPVNEVIRKGYLEQKDYNVIVVDWSYWAESWSYFEAYNSLPGVGGIVAQLIDKLMMQLDQVYLIGHSLGAHVAGIAGKLVKSSKIETIVGLDPAGPLFSISSSDNRIDISDAKSVVVIHTNGGFLGFYEPLGTVDFYPNGGISQPGCGMDFTGMCSHSRAWELFGASLWEPDWNRVAWRMGSVLEIPSHPSGAVSMDSAKLGGDPLLVPSTKGMFYIETYGDSPFFGKKRL
ncbi:lipase member H-A-like [Uranotaenia lowii]|uniref:lipase member H-A-like n=1 Tax=Uranotaenia lowii TaxID=190385 RepID=UPI002479B14A|nr:lipase member H-A-like [Uranotaenia lowii]